MSSESSQLWENYKNDKSIANRDALIFKYLPLVNYEADKMSAKLGDAIETEVLRSEGLDGLMFCIERFDTTRDLSFSTYAERRIVGAMLDYIRRNDIVPRLIRTKAHKFEAIRAELSLKSDHVTDDDVFDIAGISVMDYSDMTTRGRAPESFSKVKRLPESFKEITLGDTMEDDTPTPYEKLERVDFLRKMLKGMNKDERILVIGYYYEGQTMKQIGQTLGLSESRISQLHTAILVRLKKMFKPSDRLKLAVTG